MRHVVRALALGLLLVAWSLPVEAAARWIIADVDRCGVRDDGLVVCRLESPDFGLKNFAAADLVSKEVLAIGLTALATKKPVRVFTDPDLPGVPDIVFMQLIDD